MKNKGCVWGIGLLVFFGAIGALMDDTDKTVMEATAVPQAQATVAPTIAPTATACSPEEWSTNFVEVYDLWGDALTITQLDAIIVKYDTKRLPYGCGEEADRLVNDVDYEVRLGLGAHRTAFMLGDGDKEGQLYFGQALQHYKAAGEKHQAWKEAIK